MTITLRKRILLTLAPIFVLIAGLGGAGVTLLYRLGISAQAILRENYDSVIAMENLNEALERIDSSFNFELAGRTAKARKQYTDNWPAYMKNLEVESNNITIPGEGALVDRLSALTARYRAQGDTFYGRPEKDARREEDYYGPGGLLQLFNEIKDVSSRILHLNQENMEQASRTAKKTAMESLIWFGFGLSMTALLAAVFAWQTIRATLRPIQAVTHAALGISAGNLDQVVPSLGRDELGQLARAFNTMSRYLRDYRQSHGARLLRAQRTTQATIDAYPDPVIIVDSEGCAEMANPAARRLLGITPKTPDDKTTAAWQPPEPLRSPLADALQNQRDYLPEGFDHALQLETAGQQQSFLPRILTIRDPYGNTLGAAVLFQDVTRFRLLDQLKSNLVATVSHELKTPLTGLRMDLHLALEETVGPLTPKQTELLLDARDNAERLLAIVNNLLDLGRLEQGVENLDRRPVDPRELVQSAAEAISPRAVDKGLELVIKAPAGLPPVAADAERIGYALANLLDNAVTYTDRGGRIMLEAAADSDHVLFTLSDTGVGIPPDQVPHVFDRFFRVPGQTRGSGTGLGLAIVREIITAHDGTITCESQHGSGTFFRIKLPLWDAAGQASSHPDGKNGPGKVGGAP
jgi:signal transduction histidine kinase